jgi:hypothetical protein
LIHVEAQIPGGFVLPAQPVEANRPPAVAEWVHEIKRDGCCCDVLAISVVDSFE